jgi:molybdopterin-guanine dinucleotide biosynthesis protein A
MNPGESEPLTAGWVLLLGGGQGRRAGGPKALKLLDGRPWWRWQAERVAGDGLRPLAVLHPDAWQSPEPPQPGEAAISDPSEPAFLSLKRGIVRVPFGVPLWVLPIDCPWPGKTVLTQLQAPLASGAWLAVVPQAVDPDGRLRGGHPLGLSPLAVEQLRAIPWEIAVETRLDHWLRAHSDQTLRLTVQDPAVLANHNLNGIDR